MYQLCVMRRPAPLPPTENTARNYKPQIKAPALRDSRSLQKSSHDWGSHFKDAMSWGPVPLLCWVFSAWGQFSSIKDFHRGDGSAFNPCAAAPPPPPLIAVKVINVLKLKLLDPIKSDPGSCQNPIKVTQPVLRSVSGFRGINRVSAYSRDIA